jgi:hypothetical protein
MNVASPGVTARRRPVDPLRRPGKLLRRLGDLLRRPSRRFIVWTICFVVRAIRFGPSAPARLPLGKGTGR